MKLLGQGGTKENRQGGGIETYLPDTQSTEKSTHGARSRSQQG